jgi:hypothetical protein
MSSHPARHLRPVRSVPEELGQIRSIDAVRRPSVALRDGRRAPRWAVVAAHLVPLAVLPSSLWRIPVALGYSMGLSQNGATVAMQGGQGLSILGLSLASEAVALLTLGLVRPWGERVPGWIPVLGGRRVPPVAAIAPAAAGALALLVIWGSAFRNYLVLDPVTFSHTGWEVLLVACYLPLLLWAPLLAAVTYAYYRRRCRD